MFKKILAVLVAIVLAVGVVGYFSCHLDITLEGDGTVELTDNSVYEEPGATASLNTPFGIMWSGEPTIISSVNDTKVGTYEVKYSVSYLCWSSTATRTVKVSDTKPPVLTLNGSATPIVAVGATYTEEGWSAIDDYDGDVTEAVEAVTDGDTITYTVKDSSGNETTATRTIKHSDPNKIVYLTFDDGPGDYTQQLLDVLAKHNAKATFFVTGNGDASMIKKEYEAGHAIGVHSYTHDYAKIYVSEEAYLADFEAMEKVIEEQTGSRTWIFRFPGGSSNTVSKHYSTGIMTQLAKDMEAKGYRYFDWNVSSGDAGGATTSDQVYNNVIKEIQENKQSVVLQHDIKQFSVEAVDRILTWGEQNGYTFLSLDKDSFGAHHSIAN